MKDGERSSVEARRHLQPAAGNRRPYRCELEIAPGLEAIALAEVRQKLKGQAHTGPAALIQQPGALQFPFRGDLRALFQLRTVNAAYLVLRFPIPRPRALLGDQHFRALVSAIRRVRSLHPERRFVTLAIRAAGRRSSVLQRLQAEIARATDLRPVQDQGDLWMRLRRPLDGGSGWEVLLRLTPRPLSTRPWRVCNYPGALNATVAHAMAQLTQPASGDGFLNVACGSGTILIERLTIAPARQALACDVSPAALACARKNLRASGLGRAVDLLLADGRRLPLQAASVDVACADLPFGSLVGTHDSNLTLYPALLGEMSRVLRPSGRFVLITHEVRLMERLLERQGTWQEEDRLRVNLRGLHPRIYSLRRASP